MVELLSARDLKENRPYRRLEGIFLGQFPPTKPECSPACLVCYAWPVAPRLQLLLPLRFQQCLGGFAGKANLEIPY